MPIPLLIPAALAAYTAISGAIKKGKANKLASENQRKDQPVPAEITDNAAIAKNMSTIGLTGPQLTRAQQQIESTQSNAIAGAQNRKSALASIGAVTEQTNDAKANLTVTDANARIANIKNLMANNEVTASWKDKVWNYNVREKYQENAAAIRALNAAADSDINTAIDMGASTLLAATDKGSGQSAAASRIVNMRKQTINSGSPVVTSGGNQMDLSKIDPEILKQILEQLGKN